ncbi:hypothetical protein Tco_1271380 [Tanacetum coccineum]
MFESWNIYFRSQCAILHAKRPLLNFAGNSGECCDVLDVNNKNTSKVKACMKTEIIEVNASDLENVVPVVHVRVGSSINLGSVEEIEGEKLIEKVADLVKIEESKKELETEMDSI